MTISQPLAKYKNWFSQRDLREKLLVCALSWACIYAIFSLFLFQPIDSKHKGLSADLKKTKDEIYNWKTQLAYLQEIPKTPLYKEWSKERTQFLALKNKYKNVIGKSNNDNWDNIIKKVLSSYPNITVEKIENESEKPFQTSKIASTPETIFQQQMRLTVLGNYQDVVSYLASLENTLPNLHWNLLTYEVTDYPVATVTMGFSILYEKNEI